MTVTVAEAQTKLAQIIARAEAGEAVFIGREPGRSAVKSVPLALCRARLARHPDLSGPTVTHDPAALVQPLPPGEWGDLARPDERDN
jgi:antitoxin (DNA-binding transcriptional repressor) of toxin-antitoxin stability system